jgi:hypothetical protein
MTIHYTYHQQYTGVFRQGIDDVQVSSVSIHPHGRLIAASYANGDVRVFRYPCISQQVDDRDDICSYF